MAPSLTLTFQVSLDTGRLPQDWLGANVSCAFKKGDHHSPGNYRHLTTVPCKILEHIIYRHIMSHLEANSILTNLNHGFRSETQPLISISDLLTSFNKGKEVDMAIRDL